MDSMEYRKLPLDSFILGVNSSGLAVLVVKYVINELVKVIFQSASGFTTFGVNSFISPQLANVIENNKTIK